MPKEQYRTFFIPFWCEIRVRTWPIFFDRATAHRETKLLKKHESVGFRRFSGHAGGAKIRSAGFFIVCKKRCYDCTFFDSGNVILAVHKALTTLGKDRGIAAQQPIGASLKRSKPAFIAAGAHCNDRPRGQRQRRRTCP
jgi:hypothetical protein